MALDKNDPEMQVFENVYVTVAPKALCGDKMKYEPPRTKD